MSVESPLRLYISSLPRPYIIPYRRAQTFEDFQQIANRILVSCIDSGELQSSAEGTPRPGNWNVLEENGSIVSSLLWQDLLVPGAWYCLVPRQESAVSSAVMRASQSQGSTAEISSSRGTPARSSSNSVSSPSVTSVSSGSTSDIPILSPHISYRDALSAKLERAQQPQQQSTQLQQQLQNQASYSFFSTDESDNGVRLNQQEPPPLPTQNKNSTSPRSLIPSNSRWAAVAASGLNGQNSITLNDWTVVQSKKPITSTLKPLVQIKVWKNESLPSSVSNYSVPATISVGEFIERIGGREGCRVQEMRRAREGLLPGLTYMWGTQKSIEDVGWADRKRGTVGATIVITAEKVFADSPPTVCRLEIAPHFASLSPREKLYAHHISRASFLGSRVTLRQHSPESEAIYDLILATYRCVDGDWKKLAKDAGVSDENVKFWLEYATAFLSSMGNYKSFGDLKFIPRIPKGELQKLVNCDKDAKAIFEKVADVMYSIVPEEKNLLGYIDAGHVSAYYPDSPTITKAEIQAVQVVALANGILVENTRLKKISNDEFHLLFGSSATSAPDGQTTEYTFDGGKKLKLVYGDYSELMAKISEECLAAAETSANDIQEKMWREYARSFTIGSIQAHKESQKLWVQDKGPRVESNIGFVETYRDPHGVRAEWEGFAAVVNDERTRTFGELVRRAEEFIVRLPWGKEFEKKEFLKPDFTSLEVLAFAGAGIPAGINIPNYDDIRQEIGFKNVSLGNILSAKSPTEVYTFLSPADAVLFGKYQRPSFEVQVGVHELLGHGTGKLLQETSPGVFNFDHTNPPISPITHRPITSWYKPGETWGGVFGGVAASYEECRAELVAMYLGIETDILSIFGHPDPTIADDIAYIEYLMMARAGLLALETWDPNSEKWGQAHSQARFFILNVFLSAQNDFVTFHHSAPDMSDLVVSLDRSKIRTHGRKAVADFLTKLQVYKATADVAAGKELYAKMTAVDDRFRAYRNVVMKLKQPRKSFVQPNTLLEKDGAVRLVEYDETPEGMVKSYAERGV